jgi:hypothetical protein
MTEKWFYLISLQWTLNGGHGSASSTRGAVFSMPQGAPRHEVVPAALEAAKAAAGAPKGAVVLSCLVERDEQ